MITDSDRTEREIELLFTAVGEEHISHFALENTLTILTTQ